MLLPGGKPYGISEPMEVVVDWTSASWEVPKPQEWVLNLDIILSNLSDKMPAIFKSCRKALNTIIAD